MEIIEKKKHVIDNVQNRIDKWIGRSDMTFYEALFLNGKHYPFRILINPLIFGSLFAKHIVQSEIRYSELYHLLSTTDVEAEEEEEEKLFRYVLETYLTHCFGG